MHVSKINPIAMALMLMFMLCSHAAIAQIASPFDGNWNVVLDCPPHDEEDDDAKGYTHRFSGKVVNGELTATYGSEGKPGWHLLKGTIAADGKADLRLEGIVSKEAYAVNNAKRGKPYSYRVRAKFEPTKGAGQRVGRRKCSFSFDKS